MPRSYTVDDSTYASNPGNVRIKPLVWLWHQPYPGLLLALGQVATLGLNIFHSPWWVLANIPLFCVNYYYWLGRKEHFAFGDSNAGLVVAENPTLVAVSTNFQKYPGYEYPVIKIIPYRKRAKVGTHIATVALYRGTNGPQVPHWDDFFPIPLDYATNDQAEIERALRRYDAQQQWRDIEQRLRQVPQPYVPGLYRIDSADWVEDTQRK